ncbi:hypothetical protein CsSME_00000717 [Camellia sinensis var. sinensis]
MMMMEGAMGTMGNRGNGRGNKDDDGDVNGKENDDIGIKVVCQYNVQHSSESENIKLKIVNGDKTRQRKKKGWGNEKRTLEVALNIGIIRGAALVMMVAMSRSALR